MASISEDCLAHVKIKKLSFAHNLVIVTRVSVVPNADESLLTRTAYGTKSEA